MKCWVLHFKEAKSEETFQVDKSPLHLNPIQDGPFQGYSRIGRKGPSSLNLSHISYNDETWHIYTLTKEDLKTYKSRDRPLEFCWHHRFLPEISNFFWYKISNLFIFVSVCKGCFKNMVAILIVSDRTLTALGLLIMQVFWNKVYYVIIFIHDVINKNVSRNSIYILDVVM